MRDPEANINIPTSPPYDESRVSFSNPDGLGVTKPVWPGEGGPKVSNPINRVASDNEFVRVAQGHHLKLEDIAAGLPHSIPEDPMSGDLLHPIQSGRQNNYLIESQRRENLSPDKAYVMAKAEDTEREKALHPVETKGIAADRAGYYGKIALDLVQEAGGMGGGSAADERYEAQQAAYMKSPQHAADVAARKAGIAYDQERALQMLGQKQQN